jgi:mxaJ protein
MYSLCRSRSQARRVVFLAGAMAALPVFGADLRVCADPNNLPFSNQAQKGFENRIAELLAHDLGMNLQYVWWSERKNFIENSLNAGRCDAVMGVPAGIGSVELTKPYYRSTYVIVSPKGRGPAISSLIDERLASLRIGIHIIDNDYAPPAQLLGARGLSANLVGFSLYGKQNEPNPPARLIDAVSGGDVDVAVVWGPFAGYFGNGKVLELAPVVPVQFRGTPFVYEIAVAVRKGDTALRTRLDESLTRQCAAIQTLLGQYKVPQVLEGQPLCASVPQVYASSR